MREWDLDLGKASRRHAHARQTAPTEAHVALQLWITRSSERCSARWCRALPIPRHARAHALHRRLGLKTFGPRSQVCPALGPPCAPARTSLPCHAVERALTHTRIPAQRRPATSWCFGTADDRSPAKKTNRQTLARSRVNKNQSCQTSTESGDCAERSGAMSARLAMLLRCVLLRSLASGFVAMGSIALDGHPVGRCSSGDVIRGGGPKCSRVICLPPALALCATSMMTTELCN